MKKDALRGIVLGVVLAGSLPVAIGSAAESTKALPTLLIKGEVVSIDTNDPTANLLKVKDRYGFETPIFLTQETKIAKGDMQVVPANLAAGTPVEVEYNFDVNTAKRHAVSVKVGTQDAATQAASATPATSSSSSRDAIKATPAAPAAPTESAPAAPSAPVEDTTTASQQY